MPNLIPVGQDFNVITLNKTRTGTNRPRQTQIDNSVKIEQNAEDGIFEHKKVSLGQRQSIIKARADKKMTQKQLAAACNFTVQLVQSYENGTAIPNRAHLNKMGRVLGTNL